MVKAGAQHKKPRYKFNSNEVNLIRKAGQNYICPKFMKDALNASASRYQLDYYDDECDNE